MNLSIPSSQRKTDLCYNLMFPFVGACRQKDSHHIYKLYHIIAILFLSYELYNNNNIMACILIATDEPVPSSQRKTIHMFSLFWYRFFFFFFFFFFQGDLNTKQKKKLFKNHHIIELGA